VGENDIYVPATAASSLGVIVIGVIKSLSLLGNVTGSECTE
jgi:hypothetical protein